MVFSRCKIGPQKMVWLAFYLFVSSNNATKHPDRWCIWQMTIGNLALFWYVTNMKNWNSTISIGIGGWWYYFNFWGVLLVYVLCVFACFVQAFVKGCVSDSTLDVRNACTKDAKHAESALTLNFKQWNNTTNHLCQSEEHCFNVAHVWWWSFFCNTSQEH